MCLPSHTAPDLNLSITYKISYVSPCPRCRRRRGLLKIPNSAQQPEI